MPFAPRWADQLPPAIADELEHLMASLQAWIAQEHTEQGGHGAIAPTAITLQGAPLGVPVPLIYKDTRYLAETGTWDVSDVEQRRLRVTRIGQLAYVEFFIEGELSDSGSTFITITVEELSPDPLWTAVGSNTEVVGGAFWVVGTTPTPGLVLVSGRDPGSGNPNCALGLALPDGSTWDAGDIAVSGYAFVVVRDQNIALG